MKKIPLSQGKVVLVDDADYNWLNQWRWCVRQNRQIFYAQRQTRLAKYKQRSELMHRQILGLRPGDKRECDHIDGDGLNNQRSNLRVCTGTQNQQSRRKRKVGTSKYKGVWWDRYHRKWQSRIRVNEKQIHLGYFDSETFAAEVYNRATLKHFGRFAVLNTI